MEGSRPYNTGRRARRRRMSRKRAFALLRTFTILAALVLAILALTRSGPFSRRSPGGEVGGEGEVVQASGGGAEEPPRRANLKASDTEPPTIAIVVDDVGSTSDTLDLWLKIDAPLTFAAFPYCADLRWMIERLYDQGYEIMLHMPTENNPPDSYSGYGQLNVGMTREEAFAALDRALASVPHAEGINNHQGGRGCNDLQLMTLMCEWARERGSTSWTATPRPTARSRRPRSAWACRGAATRCSSTTAVTRTACAPPCGPWRTWRARTERP